jgi:beta-glucosidase
MHVTAHRFSLEWSVIEPESGKIDLKAVQLYRTFIQELKKAGIEPYVTLHHFVLPDWVGDFDDPENIDRFATHCLKMMELFPDVTNWLTFNEPGVYAFSTRMRGAYPPGEKGNLIGTAHVLRNLLIAHCKIYQAAKEKFRDKVQIGITHQWLRFVPLEGNFVERSICHILSKITHYCVYDFFKTGRFDFEIATKANVHLTIPEKEFQANRGFLDFIGVQFYGYPRLKAGFNGGEEYPGYKTNNINLGFTGLTFGATCPKGGKTLSFGPSFYPESLEACLTEAAALKKPIAITETGCDARIQKWGEKELKIDDETQREYFEKIAPIMLRFKDQMKAFFVWTLYRGQLEWERGDFPALGVVKFKKDAARNITGSELTPAAKLLQKVFSEKKHEMKKRLAA